MTVPKVTPPALMTDQVFNAIHQAIMSGDLPAGYRLRIRDIAAQVGTSVMPVREAIRRLEEAGIAERVPHKGTVVRALTLDELVHIYDARRVLEVEAARQGAHAISAADTKQMRRHYRRILTAVSEGDLVGALDADEAMLETLYRAGGNPVLTELIRSLWQRCRAYKIAGAHRAAAESDDSAWSVYQPKLVEAARSNDARAAATLTEQSLRHAIRRIQTQLADQSTNAKQH
ncbi:MAG TPA: GntR family transcriptional regulator [Jatrophihabitantaceae bacterium]|jgi:DNA-binding GntR family transcriptional regulator